MRLSYHSIFFVLLGCGGLFTIYLFQDYLDFYSLLSLKWPSKLDYSPQAQNVDVIPFVINKVFRYIFNDLFAICIIYGFFKEKKYMSFSFFVMIFGMVILLPTYIVFFLHRPEGFSSMISHLHRIVMNPVLMMLLIPAFFYQKKIWRS